MADEELIHAVQSGDQEAFALLVAEHRSRVFGLASRFARDAHQLDDLAQEVFIKVWQGIGQYRAQAPFEHWLSRIAVRVCYDFLRRNRRFPLFRAVPIEEVDLPEAPSSSCEAARERVESALAELKPQERLVLTLLELEGMSMEEVADMTGWSVANVKVRAFRARKRLKEIILTRFSHE